MSTTGERQAMVTHAMIGIGSIFMGPRPIDADTSPFSAVSIIVPPGVRHDTPYDYEGSSEATTWRKIDYDVLEKPSEWILEDQHPDRLADIGFLASRAWAATLETNELELFDEWAKDRMMDCMRGWCTILSPATKASANLKRKAMTRLDDAILDTAIVWGEDWFKQQITPRMQQRFSEVRQEVQ